MAIDILIGVLTIVGLMAVSGLVIGAPIGLLGAYLSRSLKYSFKKGGRR